MIPPDPIPETTPEPSSDGGPVEMYGPHPAAANSHAPASHHAHARTVSGRMRRRLVAGLLIVLAGGGVAVGAGMLTGFLPHPVVAGDKHASKRTEPATGPQAVKVVRAKRDPNFRLSVQRIGTVEPFYQAGLRARAAGIVRFVAKDIGEPVRAGELLVEIDVPDLQYAVRQKDAMVEQRRRELAAAEADLVVARNAVAAAKVGVHLKELEVLRAKDSLAARKIDLEQIRVLFDQKSVVQARVDAAQLDYQAAERAVEVAEADVEKAKVEQAGKTASLEKAIADVQLKRSLIDVAVQDRAIAAAQFEYSRVYAPFDGVVVGRTVDPGKFVPNATTGASEPLVTVARVDLVTVVMKLPDDAAAFVGPATEAAIEFQQLPGITARGRISRFSPYIEPGDRTMRVEVDLYNGTPENYRWLLTRSAAATTLAPLVPVDPLAGLTAAGAGRFRTMFDRKGDTDGTALLPNWGLFGRGDRRILPGMTPTIRVFLDKFTDAYVLPAGVVYNRNGQPYVLLIEDGRTRAVPVSVQLNDGRLVKVALVDTVGGRQVTRELTGNEVIVSTRQQEVGENQRVEPVFQTW